MNDITRRSDIDANECLKDMLSWCDYNHEVTCIKLTCVVNYSKIYVGKHQWSAEANIYDKHSSHWMKYTRKGALGDDTPELSTSSFDEYVDSNLEEWKVAVFEVIDLKEEKDLMLEYLSYMGGQEKVFCSVHERVPLVSVKPKQELTCSYGTHDSPCGEKVIYTCPHRRCEHSICLFHHNEKCDIKNKRSYKVLLPVKPQCTIARKENNNGLDENSEGNVNFDDDMLMEMYEEQHRTTRKKPKPSHKMTKTTT